MSHVVSHLPFVRSLVQLFCTFRRARNSKKVVSLARRKSELTSHLISHFRLETQTITTKSSLMFASKRAARQCAPWGHFSITESRFLSIGGTESERNTLRTRGDETDENFKGKWPLGTHGLCFWSVAQSPFGAKLDRVFWAIYDLVGWFWLLRTLYESSSWTNHSFTYFLSCTISKLEQPASGYCILFYC